MQGPILVTHHGRPRLVILSAEEFSNLTEGAPDGRASENAATAPVESGRANFIANMFEGFVAFDGELRVRYLNSVASASAGRDPNELIGKAVDSPE
ncbi:MAG: type II toxin-antitoxin system prevent-host-death family antitoxin, partial [Phenylobacterium sp.]